MFIKLMLLLILSVITHTSFALSEANIDAINTLYALQSSITTPNYAGSVQTRDGVSVSSRAIHISRKTLSALEQARASRPMMDVLVSMQNGPGLNFGPRHKEYYVEEINRTIDSLMQEEY